MTQTSTSIADETKSHFDWDAIFQEVRVCEIAQETVYGENKGRPSLRTKRLNLDQMCVQVSVLKD